MKILEQKYLLQTQKVQILYYNPTELGGMRSFVTTIIKY